MKRFYSVLLYFLRQAGSAHLLAVLCNVLHRITGADRGAQLNNGHPDLSCVLEDWEPIAQGQLSCCVGRLEDIFKGLLDPRRAWPDLGWRLHLAWRLNRCTKGTWAFQ